VSEREIVQQFLHRSETWPGSKENEVPLQQAEMRMVRWMHNRVPSKELRERLGLYIILILQQNKCCEKKTMIG